METSNNTYLSTVNTMDGRPNLKRRSYMKRSIWLATLTASLLATSISHAGDCKQVKFKFINKWSSNFTTDVIVPAKIKVKKVSVVGNDKTWKEDINNHRINYGDSHTTNKRRLNGLDSGASGDFTVEFDYKVDNGWVSGTHGPFTIECNDGDTIKFTIMH